MRVCLRVIPLLFAVLIPLRVEAQQDDEYLKYKFYAEEEPYHSQGEEPLWWLAENVDSIKFHTPSAKYSRFNSSTYALRHLEYHPRGEAFSEEQHLVGDLDVGYSTARLITALGIDRGVGRLAFQPTSYGRSTSYNIFNNQAGRTNHRLGAQLSGRGYLGSFSYRATYPIYNVVRLKSDWQLSNYLRINTGRDLYIEGVSGNGFEIAVSAQRNWLNNSLFIAAMLPWSRRSVRQYSVEEAFTLTNNHHYNPSWGMQDGKLRNSRQNSKLRPEVVASWWRRLGGWSDMTLTFRSAVERTGRRALAWFDAPTPMPDNYRYLPSYYTGEEQRLVTDAWSYNDLRYTQIDWDRLYATNALQRDGTAVYAVENRRGNAIIGDLVAKFTSRLRSFDIDYGAYIDIDSRREFKIADDLLGADHITDIDYFIRDDATYGSQHRNNLRDDNIETKRGDHYGYDYRLTRLNLGLFGTARWRYQGFEFELGARLSYVSIQRRGYFEKELFAGHRSYGLSPSANFSPSSINAICSYNLRNHLFKASFSARGNAPKEESVFLQAEYNNRLVENLKTGLTIATELGYEYSHSNLIVNASLFLANHSAECEVVHYYDDLANEYVDAVVSNISRLNFGFEAMASVRWAQYFNSQLTLSIGRYRYSKDASVKIYADNNNDLVANTTSHLRGIRNGTPEVTISADISYRRAGWRAAASLEYWGVRYVSASAVRRTERMMNYASSTNSGEALKSQQRLNDAVSLGVNISKSFKFENKGWLSIRLAVDNLLNSGMIYGGYEQHRVRSREVGNTKFVEPFANKLSYAYGRTIRLAITFGFQPRE